MEYEISEGNSYEIKSYGIFIKIEVKDISLFFCKEYKKIIELALKDDDVFKYFSISDDIFNLITDYIFNDYKINILIENLIIRNFPLYSIILNTANNYKKKYEIISNLGNVSKITFRCNSNNLFNILSMVSTIDKPIILDTTDISLEEYKKILLSFDFKSIEGLNIKVNYQKENSFIDPKSLYDTSLLICDISEAINKTKLSPFEKIMYAYDIVKNRKYKKCNDDLRKSRDLDKVLVGDAIVCVGYSNFLNAVLYCSLNLFVKFASLPTTC